MISNEMQAREKGFRMNPGITYFHVLIVETFKAEIGEIVTKSFEKKITWAVTKDLKVYGLAFFMQNFLLFRLSIVLRYLNSIL